MPVGVALALALLAVSCSGPAATSERAAYDVEERTIDALQQDLTAGRLTSLRLVEQYLARIRDLDQNGPALHSVLAVNPRAADDARALDAERASGRVRGPLHGIPILVKDNIETSDPLPTTAGSLALTGNLTNRDAPVVARLRAAGVIVLGKTNLSEWANIRSTHSTSGWSAIGGLTKNPYALDRNPCGSSSGSGAAVAANLAVASLGTETDGSVTCPASINGLVGVKPTVGLVSRRHIIPISTMQDTAGPMARTVADAAALLTVMAGRDELDPATREADDHRADYVAALLANALAGKRLAVLRFLMGELPQVDAIFDAAVERIKAAGATVVFVESENPLGRLGDDELKVLVTDFRMEVNAYLASTPPAVVTRSLADLIAFNKTNAVRELPYFGQEIFEQAEMTATADLSAHRKRQADNRKAAGPDGIDRLLKAHNADALIAPTVGPAWVTDLVNGDRFSGSATSLPAIAGYPHVTVPMGAVSGLPVGLSFIGTAWSEAALLSMAYAFEQQTRARRPPDFED